MPMATLPLLLLGLAVLVVVGLVVTLVLLRAAARRRRATATALAASRAQVDALGRRVEDLATEVDRTRAEVERAEQRARLSEADREYVITTLAAGAPDDRPVVGGPPQHRPPAVHQLQEQLVRVLADQQQRSPLRARAVDVAVRTVALGHGVRRALQVDNLDRAAAEAHVARRRSRRLRKQEVREARRLLRQVRAQQGRPLGQRQGDAA